MLFKALVVRNLTLESNVFDQNGNMKFSLEKFSIPAGTIVDVYGVTAGTYNNSKTFSLFVIYHNSLPHFFQVDSTACRPV